MPNLTSPSVFLVDSIEDSRARSVHLLRTMEFRTQVYATAEEFLAEAVANKEAASLLHCAWKV